MTKPKKRAKPEPASANAPVKIRATLTFNPVVHADFLKEFNASHRLARGPLLVENNALGFLFKRLLNKVPHLKSSLHDLELAVVSPAGRPMTQTSKPQALDANKLAAFARSLKNTASS